MYLRDWNADVCSSDLPGRKPDRRRFPVRGGLIDVGQFLDRVVLGSGGGQASAQGEDEGEGGEGGLHGDRSEERRGGKGSRPRLPAYHVKLSKYNVDDV